MLPAQREFYQFVAIIVIDILTSFSKPTNFLQREETMSGPEFCMGIRAKLFEEFMADKNGRNGCDLLLRAFNFTTDPEAMGEFLNLSHKFITILQAGFFSPDFVKVQHPYKIPSNRTGKMTNQEFCKNVSATRRTAVEDAVLYGHVDDEVDVPKMLNRERISEENCDDIVEELNDLKSSPIWDRISIMVGEEDLRIFGEEVGWEIRLVDEARRLGSLHVSSKVSNG